MAEIRVNQMEIKIDRMEIFILINNVNKAKDNIEISLSDIAEPNGCSGIMINQYYDRINNIIKLMENYKQLLEKDMNDIVKSINNMFELDEKMKY